MTPVLDDRERALVERPIRLGPAQIKNRVFVAPHTTNFGVSGENLVTSRHLDYHRARARGGAGLIITEGIRVHPTSLRRLGIHAYSDEALPGLTSLAQTAHGEGAAIFGQLLHTGRHTGDEMAGSWGPSPDPWSTTAAVPHVMNQFDVDTLIEGFVGAARRLLEAGFDGMEVHIGHGHLLHQFLSPITNHRTDRYGGSPAARLELAREVIDAVRGTVAGRAAVGLRLSANEFLPGGLDPDSMIDIVAALASTAPFDFLHVSHAAYIGTSSLSTQMADMSYGPTPFLEFPRRFREAFPESPVLAICRIEDLHTGAEILEHGDADMVGFARGHIAEPRLLSLSVTGSPSPRTCIACNQGCNANLEAVTPITCTVNPAVGHEREWDAAEAVSARSRSVLVVGAGPAGIEAAVTAASRGHRVQLVDRRDEIGGQLNDVVRLDGRPGFATLLRELRESLGRSTVQVALDRAIGPQDIVESNPDVLVLATGAAHASSSLSDVLSCPVLDPETVLLDPGRAGSRAVVFDELGTWEASGIAMHLARRGVDTILATPISGFAQRVTIYSRLGLADQLVAAGVSVRSDVSLEGHPEGLQLSSRLAGSSELLTDVDAVVHVRPRRSTDELVSQLRGLGWEGELYTVGDAFAPRTSQEAIAEGRGVGFVIGVDDPAIARGLRMRPPYHYAPALSGAGR